MDGTRSEFSVADRPEESSPATAASGGARARKTASPNHVLAIVCVGICLANLDLFIVNVGLPNIGRDMAGASLEDLSWILNGYAIAYAALLIFFGRLAERHRRDRSFLLGVALFTAASAACAVSTSVETLVAFRIVQAAGAALMTPTSLGLLLAVFPPEKRGAAVRTWTAIGGLAAALGPLVGGLLVQANWRFIFLVNVPIGLVAMIVGWLRLPRVEGHDAPRPRALDAFLVTIGVGALVFAIVKLQDWGWRSPGIAVASLVATAALALFAQRCFALRDPFVDPALFRIRPFAGAVLVMAPYSAAFGGMLLSIALWEQSAWGWSAMKAGLSIAPGPLMVPITSLLVAGRLIARYGAAPVVAAGILSFASGLLLWATFIDATPSVALAALGMIPTGIGVGLTFPTVMGVGVGALPPSAFATGSGVINMIRQAALAVGVALFVAIVGAPSTMAERLAAYHFGWWAMAAMTLIGLIPTLAMIRPRRG
ncbi:MAG: MFS transporter [Hyphomicrobiales bacterium]|nr:MFS transporter [Hyphomicrobiales bacterium]